MTAAAKRTEDPDAQAQIGAQTIAVCMDGLRLHPDNLIKAWAHVGTEFGYDFLRMLAADMGLPPIKERTFRPIQSKIVPPEQIERRRKLRDVLRSKYKNSAGVSWSDIGWHELPALSRDGNEAAALLEAGPASVPNDGRTVGQVLGIILTDHIIKATRSAPQSSGLARRP